MNLAVPEMRAWSGHRRAIETWMARAGRLPYQGRRHKPDTAGTQIREHRPATEKSLKSSH